MTTKLYRIIRDELIFKNATHENCPPDRDLLDCLEKSGWNNVEGLPWEESKNAVKHPNCMVCWKRYCKNLIRRIKNAIEKESKK